MTSFKKGDSIVTNSEVSIGFIKTIPAGTRGVVTRVPGVFSMSERLAVAFESHGEHEVDPEKLICTSDTRQ